MSESGQAMSNLEYDVVTTLSNLLQGDEALGKYAQDAEREGNSQAAQIFRSIQQNNKDAARQLRGILPRVIGQAD